MRLFKAGCLAGLQEVTVAGEEKILLKTSDKPTNCCCNALVLNNLSINL